MASSLESGANIGVDPFLMPVSEWNKMKKSLDGTDIRLIEVKKNLVDLIWGSDQPNRPNQPIIPLELKFSGKSWEDKVQEMRSVPDPYQNRIFPDIISITRGSLASLGPTRCLMEDF